MLVVDRVIGVLRTMRTRPSGQGTARPRAGVGDASCDNQQRGFHGELTNKSAELINTRPDVLVGYGTLPAKAAKASISTIPIVFASVGDPVGAGLIDSLNRPGGCDLRFPSHSIEKTIGS